MHTSVGAILEKDNKILMLNRKKKPLGWANPAGHVEENETFENALIRELKEETGLTAIKFELVINEYIPWNECSRGVKGHDCYIFQITEWNGELRLAEDEAHDLKWVELENLKKIKLEPLWEYFLKKLNKI